MLGHTSIQMTMRHVHPAEEQQKIAPGKLEAFRIAGIVQAYREKPLGRNIAYYITHYSEPTKTTLSFQNTRLT
jgi:hypothetical protein